MPPIRSVFPEREVVDASITFDSQGILYAACTVGETIARDVKSFGHPSREVVLLTSADKGKHFHVCPISKKDSKKPNWHPSIERPFSSEPLDHIPALLYTHGGPGVGCRGGPATEVVFVRLGK